jgi:hypothetical protein
MERISPLAKSDRPGFAPKSWLVKAADRLVEFLDPHLRGRSEAENIPSKDRWRPRKVVLLIVGVSVIFWAALFAVVRILFSQ